MKPEFGTHWRTLLAAVENTAGPILELGAGWYSTPFLHVIADRRPLLTVETDFAWLAPFTALQSDTHHLRHVDTWFADHDFYREPWAVVLLDQDPHVARLDVLNRMRRLPSLFVLHDSEVEPARRLLLALQFRHVIEDTPTDGPWTMVLSDRPLDELLRACIVRAEKRGGRFPDGAERPLSSEAQWQSIA